MASRSLLCCAATAIAFAGCSRPSSPGTSQGPTRIEPTATTSTDGHVAVVELFTSEGCSSCPKADALLTKLVAEERASKRNVLFLSFHVDYWDGLGFPDPWASAAYTARQRAYAKSFQQSGVYTPQAVISGTDEIVGSDESGLREKIETAYAKRALVKVSLTIDHANEPSLDVAYSLEGSTLGAVVHAALVERGLVDTPTNGENEGTTIHHDDVVRAFETVQAAPEGHVALSVPSSVRRERAAVVVFVQRTTDLVILGGAMRDL